MRIEKYSHVMHIVSTITGKVSHPFNWVDALAATFPAGTVSGAPKIRAMQIINELEPDARGPYAGSVIYISADGVLDSCITIRTLFHRDGTLYGQAGAGIVYDSVPEKEYIETINKVRALFSAVYQLRQDSLL
jgi:anthranilate synthase component 1